MTDYPLPAIIKALDAENDEVEIEVKDGELRVPCEVYSRVVGYLRPVDNWNTGKRQEFQDRVMFNDE